MVSRNSNLIIFSLNSRLYFSSETFSGIRTIVEIFFRVFESPKVDNAANCQLNAAIWFVARNKCGVQRMVFLLTHVTLHFLPKFATDWPGICPNFLLVREINIWGSNTDESRVTVTHVTSKTSIYDSDGRIYQNQPYLFVAESKYSPLFSLVSSNSRLLTGRLCFKSSSVSLLPVIPDSFL